MFYIFFRSSLSAIGYLMHYLLPWLFGDKSVKLANIIWSITILPSTVHARLACPLLSREVATLRSHLCSNFFSIWIESITFKLSFEWVCLFSVQYLVYIYYCIKEWCKNPKWSFTCCLALLLPLNELQGEIQGLTETNILNQQLQTGGIEMPSIGDTLKESGAVDISLLEDQDSESEQEEEGNNEISIGQGLLTLAKISIHELPRGPQDTKLEDHDSELGQEEETTKAEIGEQRDRHWTGPPYTWTSQHS